MVEKPFVNCEGCCQWCMSQSCPERFAGVSKLINLLATNMSGAE